MSVNFNSKTDKQLVSAYNRLAYEKGKKQIIKYGVAVLSFLAVVGGLGLAGSDVSSTARVAAGVSLSIISGAGNLISCCWTSRRISALREQIEPIKVELATRAKAREAHILPDPSQLPPPPSPPV